VKLSESERVGLTPTLNHWEGTDGRYSRGSSRTKGGKTPGDGSLQGYCSGMG